MKIGQNNKSVFSPTLGIILLILFIIGRHSDFIHLSSNEKIEICPNPHFHVPSTYNKFKDTILKTIINDENFKAKSMEKLRGAVNIRTEVHDDDPKTVEEAPDYWRKFHEFEKYLHYTFPLFVNNTELHRVNTHGLVYIWQGSNHTLKPLTLMAHQDTSPVPEDTIPQWKYAPFDGYYDGTRMWGRGVADCKNLLIGLLEASEELIKVDFKPRRTIIFSFGFDEEVSGPRNKNAEFLLSKYGKDSMYAVVDEGGVSLMKINDQKLGNIDMALVGTGEKGFMVLSIDLRTPGGHASVPPDHTSIGIMSELIADIERTQFDPVFSPQNPTFNQYLCIAEHSVGIDRFLRSDILKAEFDEEANTNVKTFIDKSKNLRYYIKTSQAVDIIIGGSKSNALPEHVVSTINTRIAIEENVKKVTLKLVDNTKKFAKLFNLGLSYKLEGEEEVEIYPETENGAFRLYSDEYYDSAPGTPVYDDHWKIFAGTVRHLYEELAYPGEFENGLVVSPGIAPGNTDTKYYWDLTSHIYRYRPGIFTSVESNAHSINENIDFNSHLQIIAFYFQYIQSVDEADDSQ